MFDSLEAALKHFFGYDRFRVGQKEIIEDAIAGKDLLVIMPTGGGKSLCFQLPALLKSGLTIVYCSKVVKERLGRFLRN